MTRAAAIIKNAPAKVCRFCPLCVWARRWPGSLPAKAVRRIEKFCPACRAYAKLKQVNSNAKSAGR